MAVSERPLIDAAKLAIEEINQNGGLLGRRVEAVYENGDSRPEVFREKARKLIEQDRVCSVFGCWTSESRKKVLPEFERLGNLLWYPVQYEGDEQSPNVVYTGAVPNQQIVPALQWCLRGREKTCRVFLVGSDYVFPRQANRIVKDYLRARGLVVVGEEYRPLGNWEFAEVVEKIKTTKPDWVFNTINGDSNVAFFKELAKQGIRSDVTPVMSVSIGEVEIPRIGLEESRGHYCAWTYFQSLPTEANQRFVKEFKKRTREERVTDDPIEAAYFQVHLFARAVRRAGTTDPAQIRFAAAGLEFEAPSGWVRIDPDTFHTWKTARIGRVDDQGQFEIVWASAEPIPPDPFLRHPINEIRADPLLLPVNGLVGFLAGGDVNSRRQAARQLATVPPTDVAIRELRRRLGDGDWLVRRGAVESLITYGPPAIGPLAESVSQDEPAVRLRAIGVLARIGQSAAPAVRPLIDAFRDGDQQTRVQAAAALGQIGPGAAVSVPVLADAVRGREDTLVVMEAVEALGRIGRAAGPVLPALTDLLEYGQFGLRSRTAAAIGMIGKAMQDSKDTTNLEELIKARDVMRRLSTADVGDNLQRLENAVEMLSVVKESQWVSALWERMKSNKWLLGAVIVAAVYLIVFVLVWQVLLRLAPLIVLAANERLDSMHAKQKEISGFLQLIDQCFGATLALASHLLVIGWFRYHPRILDAWIEKYREAAATNYLNKDSVREHSVYLRLPVLLDGVGAEPVAGEIGLGGFIARAFESGRCVLIWGEGGSGKTALACQVGRWALGLDPDNALASYPMIPILIDPKLGPDLIKDADTLRETVQGQLQGLIGTDERIPAKLFDQLLRKRRLVVILDDLSELAPPNWAVPRKDFPVGALVVTSRVQESLGGWPCDRIRPERIKNPSVLASFVERYVERRCATMPEWGQAQFTQEEIADACGRLFRIHVRGKHIESRVTVLLAKLYVEQLIANKLGERLADLPRDIPSLMLGYLSVVSRRKRSKTISESLVERAATALAWECVKNDLRLRAVSLQVAEDVFASILQPVKAEPMPPSGVGLVPDLPKPTTGPTVVELLQYLEYEIGLVQRGELGRKILRFTLDPLAEYLAAFHLLQLNGSNKSKWDDFREQAKSLVDRNEPVQPFLLAIRDCCSDITHEGRVPDNLAYELGQLAGLSDTENRPQPIRVGILHSLSGDMEISERPLKNAAELAIKEINAAGGLLGRLIEAVVVDGKSEPAVFVREARRLIEEEGVCSVFGCWTSQDRIAVRPVFEKLHNLLWYPVQYEGYESSRNIIYTGAAPNQQIIPAMDYCLNKLGSRRFFLVGSNYEFPRRAHEIIRRYLTLQTSVSGIVTEIVEEEYQPLKAADFSGIGAKIKQSNPDIIINTVNGRGNISLFQRLRDAGISQGRIAVMSLSVAEAELNEIGWDMAIGHYCAWNYFQSVNTPENQKFVRAYTAEYGAGRVTDDPIEAAYFQVHLFAAAVRKAMSLTALDIRDHARGLSFQAPGGEVRIDEENQHTWKKARIGRVRPEGGFEIVWESGATLRPDPYLKDVFPVPASV